MFGGGGGIFAHNGEHRKECVSELLHHSRQWKNEKEKERNMCQYISSVCSGLQRTLDKKRLAAFSSLQAFLKTLGQLAVRAALEGQNITAHLWLHPAPVKVCLAVPVFQLPQPFTCKNKNLQFGRRTLSTKENGDFKKKGL